MNKFEKVLYLLAISSNVGAGLISIIGHNYVLGLNQLLVAWFMFLHYKNKTNKNK